MSGKEEVEVKWAVGCKNAIQFRVEMMNGNFRLVFEECSRILIGWNWKVKG
jgi:hypothetical protein